jgi:phosphonate transport system permease protein
MRFRLQDTAVAPLLAGHASAVAARRRNASLLAVALAGAIAVASVIAEVDLAVLAANIHRLPDYLARILRLDNGSPVWSDPAEWMWGLDLWLLLTGAIGGFVLCFLSATNLVRNTVVRVTAKRALEFCRTVPELVFALVFVQAFGLGPLPGILALAIHTVGALGKLFAEVVENIDMKPVDGAVSCGASWTQSIRYAVLPQVMSNFASYALLRFEINVRGAAVMGFVGAGGIGQDLIEAIRKFYYSDVSALLFLIIVTVMLIDLTTERIRHALLGWERTT